MAYEELELYLNHGLASKYSIPHRSIGPTRGIEVWYGNQFMLMKAIFEPDGKVILQKTSKDT